MIAVDNVSKSFTLHNQGSAVIPVLSGAQLERRTRANAWR